MSILKFTKIQTIYNFNVPTHTDNSLNLNITKSLRDALNNNLAFELYKRSIHSIF